MKEKSSFEFFPKEYEVRLLDAYICLLLLGTFGVHQFYLRNNKRGFYLLLTCGVSHLLILMGPIFQFLISKLGIWPALIFVLSGYMMGVPAWLWDLFTLPRQVRNFNMILSSEEK